MTDMLMVTTTMGMLNGVHGNTSNSGPGLSLSLSLEPGVGGLQEGLVGSLSAGGDANHGSAGADDGLSSAGRKSDSGLLAILGVTDDDGGSAGGSGEAASVSLLGLTVGNDGSLGHGVHGQNVADAEGRC